MGHTTLHELSKQRPGLSRSDKCYSEPLTCFEWRLAPVEMDTRGGSLPLLLAG